MILLGKIKLHFFKALRVPTWLIYTPEGKDQCAENQRRCVRWIRQCIQKTQPAHIPVGIRKSCQAGEALMGGMGVEGRKAGGGSRSLLMIRSQERLLAIIPEN